MIGHDHLPRARKVETAKCDEEQAEQPNAEVKYLPWFHVS